MLPIAISILTVIVLATALAVMIRRRLRRKKRISPVHYCENCGKRIHREERTWYWHGSHVCLACRKRLGASGVDE